MQLRGVSFEYLDPKSIHEFVGTQQGFIAQEVEAVYPQWVHTGRGGFKSVSLPTGFSALTVEAFREQQRDIGELQKENRSLTVRLASISRERRIDRLKIENLEAKVAAIENKLSR